MVTFHSYVSLPEGIPLIHSPSNHMRGISGGVAVERHGLQQPAQNPGLVTAMSQAPPEKAPTLW